MFPDITFAFEFLLVYDLSYFVSNFRDRHRHGIDAVQTHTLHQRLLGAKFRPNRHERHSQVNNIELLSILRKYLDLYRVRYF